MSEARGVPDFSLDMATRLVRDRYGVDGTVLSLPSYQDRNFRVDLNGVPAFILKIANVSETRDLLGAQHAALRHLTAQESGFRVPGVVLDVDGCEVSVSEDARGRSCLVRMLNFVPGGIAASTVARPWNPAFLESVGGLVGRLARGMAGFRHPATHRQLAWDTMYGGSTIRERLDSADTDAHRALLARVASRFDEIAGLMKTLRKSVIHNDANDLNIVVDEVDGGFVAAGLIDFGDLVHSATVAELSVAAAYALLDQPDPVEAVQHVARGFHGRFPLTDTEREVLFDLVVTRLAMCVSVSAEQRAMDPDNTYLSISERPAWEALRRLVPLDPAVATAAIWKEPAA